MLADVALRYSPFIDLLFLELDTKERGLFETCNSHGWGSEQELAEIQNGQLNFHLEWTCFASAHILLTKKSQMATPDNAVMNYTLPTGRPRKSHTWPKEGCTFLLQSRRCKIFSAKMQAFVRARCRKGVEGPEPTDQNQHLIFKILHKNYILTNTNCFAECFQKTPWDFLIGKHLGNRFFSE